MFASLAIDWRGAYGRAAAVQALTLATFAARAGFAMSAPATQASRPWIDFFAKPDSTGY